MRTPAERVDEERAAFPSRLARSATAATRMIEETRDALELAIVSGAPPALVERLAMTVGLLNAIADLSSDSPGIVALTATTMERGRTALAAWRDWQRALLPRTG